MSKRAKTVIVSNRLPVHRVRRSGSYTWQTSPGGLVSALTPILKKGSSRWVGWAGYPGSAPEPFEHEGIQNLPVRLSKDEMETYYEGFCNRTLWPLYHDAVRTPEYRRRWWRPYVEVNHRFAEAAAAVVSRGGTVWVHDYHLQLVPALIRDLRPDVRVGFFLHIPFPPQELFAQLPWRQPILTGLLGADVVGFQTRIGAQNFSQLARRFAAADGTRDELSYNGRTIHPGAFPVSIDVDRYEKLAASEAVRRRTEEFRQRLGAGRRIILGVDRMDYTKGIDIRLHAYRGLLRSERATLQECVFVQVAVPSRERVEQYGDLRGHVERLVGEINGEFGELGRTPIHYLHRNLPAEELVALYLAADVMLVTPLRDGMNLVAKEYVASRIDGTGVLVLSEFTGSAKELHSALLVNPHDIDGLEAALNTALHMPVGEQKDRMKTLRRALRRNDVFHWANTFMEALAT